MKNFIFTLSILFIIGCCSEDCCKESIKNFDIGKVTAVTSSAVIVQLASNQNVIELQKNECKACKVGSVLEMKIEKEGKKLTQSFEAIRSETKSYLHNKDGSHIWGHIRNRGGDRSMYDGKAIVLVDAQDTRQTNGICNSAIEADYTPIWIYENDYLFFNIEGQENNGSVCLVVGYLKGGVNNSTYEFQPEGYTEGYPIAAEILRDHPAEHHEHQ